MARAPWVRTVTAVVVASFALAAVVPAADAGGPGRHHQRGAWLKEKLGLTEDQDRQIRELREQQSEAHRRNFEALHQAQRELRQLVLSGAAAAAIQAKQTSLAQLMAESVRLRTEALMQIAPILTPEQRQKFAELGMRGGPGGPPPRRSERQS